MPNLLLLNGNFYTLDSSKPGAQAVAISGPCITAVGSNQEVESLASGKAWETIDLEGRCIIPGLIDSHVHLLGYALGLERLDLDGVGSLDEASHLVHRRVMASKPGEWIQGWGWNHNLWGGLLPSKWDLDQVSPKNPVALRRKDGHLIWANSLALSEAGITTETPEPAGGRIERDEHGQPTGILKENAQDLLLSIVPRPDTQTRQRALTKAISNAHQLGLTGLHDCDGAECLGDLQVLFSEGKSKIRVYNMVSKDRLEEAVAVGLRTGFGDEYLRLGAVKVFADGSLGSQTGEMLEEYLGQPGNLGVQATPQEELEALIQVADANGLACAVHAIGDKAVRRVLDAFEKVKGSSLRHRIEHAQLLHPADIARFKEIGVIASMQPIHATSDMFIADRYLGKRARYGYAWRSLLDAGVLLALGSDCPVESLNPLAGIHAAVSRQRADGQPQGGWYPQERLTVAEAVHGYTLGAAYASGEEAIKGSISVGKLADLVVLSQDIFQIPPQEILKTKAIWTVLGGQVVHQG